MDQLSRLATVKSQRNAAAVRAALQQVTETARDSSENLMPAILAAVREYATVEEIGDAMEVVFGRYVEKAIV